MQDKRVYFLWIAGALDRVCVIIWQIKLKTTLAIFTLWDWFLTATCRAWAAHAPLEYSQTDGDALSVTTDTYSVYKFLERKNKVLIALSYSRSEFSEHRSEDVVQCFSTHKSTLIMNAHFTKFATALNATIITINLKKWAGNLCSPYESAMSWLGTLLSS